MPVAAICSSTIPPGPICAPRRRCAKPRNAASIPIGWRRIMPVCSIRRSRASPPTWMAEGAYEPVAETMLGQVNYDGYFLEYDTERPGGFEPLRFLPKGNKIVVLGLITSKSGTLEKKDDVKRRIDEAAKFAPIEQFGLSPQCGFASTEEGNILTEDQQWAKMREIVELAEEVWK